MILNKSALNSTPLNTVIYTPSILPSVNYKTRQVSSLFFTCKITGITDIVIPISNINGELTADGASSIYIVCPHGAMYANDINSRLTGDIIITTKELYNDGSFVSLESNSYKISSISSDKGANSWSFVLLGKSSLPDIVPSLRVISGLSYVSTDINGKVRFRSDYLSVLRPFDTVDVDGTIITVGRISYVINSTGNTYMYCTQL